MVTIELAGIELGVTVSSGSRGAGSGRSPGPCSISDQQFCLIPAPPLCFQTRRSSREATAVLSSALIFFNLLSTATYCDLTLANLVRP